MRGEFLDFSDEEDKVGVEDVVNNILFNESSIYYPSRIELENEYNTIYGQSSSEQLSIDHMTKQFSRRTPFGSYGGGVKKKRRRRSKNATRKMNMKGKRAVKKPTRKKKETVKKYKKNTIF